ncbi:MAG TPA: anti-sigma factor domain-containing protein, partial [Firmicutes bacterium]|nr:anti-sigma factor domain-containing protein [Bacillota bacterium]
MEVKGIVVQVEQKSIVVVTPQGEFIELPRQGRQRVGEAVTLNMRSPLFPVWVRNLAAIAAALIIVIGFAQIEIPAETLRPPASGEVLQASLNQRGGIPDQAADPKYYVSLDPQPGIELAVGAEDKITAVSSWNSRPARPQVVERLVGLNVREGLMELIRAVRADLLPEAQSDELLFVTVAAASDTQERQELALRLADDVQKSLSDSGVQRVQVVALSGDLTERAAARAAKLTVGSYLAFLKAQAEGLSLTPGDIQQKGVQL